MPMFSVSVQTAPIDRASSLSVDDACGAQVRFIGTVRNDANASVALSHLVLEHFPGVTEAEIERIVAEARRRWALQGVRVVHRVGRIDVGEDIVLVETASAHRRDAYEANAYIMDFLKTEAPFWKQECFADGRSQWVEPKASDRAAARRWAAASRHAPRVGALILAGGSGGRMGSVNKGLQKLNGRPLVTHVIDALRSQADHITISANHDLAAYEALEVPIIPDEPGLQGKGPLAGILSSVPRMPRDLDAILIVPCDTPLLPADLVSRLTRALFVPGGPPAVMAATEDGHHPSIALFRPAILCTLLVRLYSAGSDLSLHGWLEGCGCEPVFFEDAAAFVNVNDRATLEFLQCQGTPLDVRFA